MKAFIVRPFGTKVPSSREVGIDFDKVEQELIQPALKEMGIQGGSTGKFLKAGNIRETMFEQLLKADLVIADVSVHNANVFYELGIRHALREKFTFIIRCSGDNYPFDLQTDRYLLYDEKNPGLALPELLEGLKNTLDNAQKDSPVFQLLPKLKPHDWNQYTVTPMDFCNEVDLAIKKKWTGDLEMLGLEAEWFDWRVGGLREVGRGQFLLKSWDGARITWEKVNQHLDGDLEANQKLATIYQRLGERVLSDQAIKRALKSSELLPYDKAELLSLKGSNKKMEWVDEWHDLLEDQRGPEAITSNQLTSAYQYYYDGFITDPGHYYSGINALALATIISKLAIRYPDHWNNCFRSDDEASIELKKYINACQELKAAVNWSVKAAMSRAKNEKKHDPWPEVTVADMVCYTADNPNRVATAYRNALSNIANFPFESAQRQLKIIKNLDILKENIEQALLTLQDLERSRAKKKALDHSVPSKVLVFTGHMIDEEDREKKGLTQRFPRGPQHETYARKILKKLIIQELPDDKNVIGIAGGACGGDILFHEMCEELNIPTYIFLVIPPKDYVVSSLQRGGPNWVERFNKLSLRLQKNIRVLSLYKELPRWLRNKTDYSIWQRNNLWTLYNALTYGASKVTLMALWNGESGDGPGGTADMVDQAKKHGAKFIHIDTNKLFKD